MVNQKYWKYTKISFVLIAWVMASGISAMAAGCAVEAGLRVAAVGIQAAAPYAKRAYEKAKETFSGDAKDLEKEEPKLAEVEPRNDQSTPDIDHHSGRNLSHVSSGDVCYYAIQPSTPKWEGIGSFFRDYVAEAKRRGLTEIRCATLSGRYNDLSKNVALAAAPKVTREKPSSDKQGCPGTPTKNPDNLEIWTDCIGTFIHADGQKYMGQWKDGKRNGQGVVNFGTRSKFAGDTYVGEFKDGEMFRQGTYTFANGNEYVGEFQNNRTHGQGTYTFANGDKYVGRWKSGKQHGQGTLTYVDGEKYTGGFRNGLHHGNGTITYANGKTLKGIWENDKFKSARD